MPDAATSAALRTALAPAIARRSLLVAAVVGTILNLINQGDVVLAGEQPQWLKIALTYAVPFLVATYGACCAVATPGRWGRSGRGGQWAGPREERKMSVPVDATLEAAARRDRLVVVGALGAVIVLAWGYLLAGAGMGMSALDMTRMSQGASTMAEGGTAGMAMMTPAVWTPGYAVLMFFMWWIMMVAMMLPSAAPMILLFATVNRKQRERGHPYVATSVFGLGYLAVWAGFSLIAVILQWGFERTGLLSPLLVGTNVVFGGIVLLAAGVYQLTPIKQACLRHCRSPLGFLMARWRPGTRGALRMGLEHGAYCVGCCWFLMGLLFFGGVMNLYWIVGLALFVLFEKTVPAGHWLGHATGIALLVWGIWLLSLAP